MLGWRHGGSWRRGGLLADEAGWEDVIDEIINDTGIEPLKRVPPRDTWAAIRCGLRGRCPACGRGRILHAYSEVNESCPTCGEEMHHHRADAFPPYITIFAVGYILGAAMLVVDGVWPNLPILIHLVIWPTLCAVLSLLLLPIFKGGLVAYQWALRMHGFETAHQQASRTPDAQDTPRKAVPPSVEPVARRSAA